MERITIEMDKAAFSALERDFNAWYDDPRHIEVIEPQWVGLARAIIKATKAS